MNPYWADRLKNGAIYVVASVLVVALIGFTFYKVFIQRNITQKTTNQAGGVINHYFENAQIKSTFGCQHLRAEEYMKALKKDKK